MQLYFHECIEFARCSFKSEFLEVFGTYAARIRMERERPATGFIHSGGGIGRRWATDLIALVGRSYRAIQPAVEYPGPKGNLRPQKPTVAGGAVTETLQPAGSLRCELCLRILS
jgi:hypothetical protein